MSQRERTVAASVGVVRGRVAQRLVGQLQLVSEPAHVALRLGLDDAQLGVDVLVFVCCIFLVLKTVWMFR